MPRNIAKESLKQLVTLFLVCTCFVARASADSLIIEDFPLRREQLGQLLAAKNTSTELEFELPKFDDPRETKRVYFNVPALKKRYPLNYRASFYFERKSGNSISAISYKGKISLSIKTGRDEYQIILPESYLNETTSIVPSRIRVNRRAGLSRSECGASEGLAFANQQPSQVTTTLGMHGVVEIDTLFVYTSAAGSSEYTIEQIEFRAIRGIQYLNESFARSELTENGTPVRFRIVGIKPLNSNALEGWQFASRSDQLDAIEDSAQIGDLRNSLGADLVQVVASEIAGGGVWGAARLGSSFSITRRHNLSDELISHEIGHQLGGGHFPGDDVNGLNNGLCSYAHGYYTNQTSNVGTIMSYASSVIPYFSNPDVETEGGEVTGTSVNDNVRCIENRVQEMSERRDTTFDPPPPVSQGPQGVSASTYYSNRIKVTWNEEPDAMFYLVYRSEFAPGCFESEFIGVAAGPYYSDYSIENGSEEEYRYSVKAYYGDLQTSFCSISSNLGRLARDGDPAYDVQTNVYQTYQVEIDWFNPQLEIEDALVYRSLNPVDVCDQSTFLSLSSATSSHVDTAAVPGIEYYYNVRLRYADTNTLSACLSDWVRGEAEGLVPQIFFVSDGLYEDRVSVYIDNHLDIVSNYDIAGFFLYRRQSSAGAFANCSQNHLQYLSEIQGTSSQIFDDYSVVPGHDYYYVARGYRSDGSLLPCGEVKLGYASLPDGTIIGPSTIQATQGYFSFTRIVWGPWTGNPFKLFRSEDPAEPGCMPSNKIREFGEYQFAYHDDTFPGRHFYYSIKSYDPDTLEESLCAPVVAEGWSVAIPANQCQTSNC